MEPEVIAPEPVEVAPASEVIAPVEVAPAPAPEKIIRRVEDTFEKMLDAIRARYGK